MMSCAGNQWLNTLAMDYIAKNGIRFTRAYCTDDPTYASKLAALRKSFDTEWFPGH